MLSRTVRTRCAVVARRFQTTVAEKKVESPLSRQALETTPAAKQAPNRNEIWAPSQAKRIDVIADKQIRFIQKDLDMQPQPYAAIDLIAKEPVRYLAHDNIAVCDGNRGSTLQGHPKVFINLDQAKPNTCGYCGLRYAKEEFRELIEKEQH